MTESSDGSKQNYTTHHRHADSGNKPGIDGCIDVGNGLMFFYFRDKHTFLFLEGFY
jgi:hypothetical protein